jgi:hypothetical protein
MKRYYRSANDPKRFKPLVTSEPVREGKFWTVTTTTFDGKLLVRCFTDWADALGQANRWADDYRAAWVTANMRAAA